MIWPGRHSWLGPRLAFVGRTLVGFIVRSSEPLMWLLAIREGNGYRDRTITATTPEAAQAEFERWYEYEQQFLAGKERENEGAAATSESPSQTISL